MATRGVLESHERRLYRQATSDGMIDLFFGVYLLCFGAAWLALGGFSVFAVVLPAALVPVAIAARSRFVQLRLGYVKWAEPRRAAEKRDRIGLLAAGVLLFLVAVSVYFLADRSADSIDVLRAVAPAIMALLLAVLALAVAYAMRSSRFLAYGALLAAAGVWTAVQDSDPGRAILACGLAVAATGLWMLIRFVRKNPVPRGE